MSIFQKSVINKHLANLDKGQVEKAYQKFRENYNSSKIEEIKKLKEEQYQDGFLRDIFVDVFGYVLAPDENHNLAREFKNVADSKKADGAILKDGKAVAVIELKSTKTKDLKSVTEQAFGYKHNQPDCKYVIISNFQKLQFFVDYANEYEEFDLFDLQRAEFELLFLLLNSESIFSDLPLKLKTETKFHEEKISDKLYKDYSLFKDKIFRNLVKNNQQYDRLDLFKKAQKFLDRLLFVFFAEDTGLVPPNAISKIIDQWQMFKDNDEYFTLYSRFVKFFVHLDKGHKYKTYELPAYNGGLFAPDEILDNVEIDDEILKNDTLLLSSYDFSTEVDVNILGHIFEHSLTEIEEITAEIAATAATRGHVPLALSATTTSKRKKDGVFYTPKYITQYIVENTVGTLCKEKRKEFGIEEIEIDESYYKKTNAMGHVPLSQKGKSLFNKLNEFKEWLLTLKIVDPACGSGAFLNQALNFLIVEHKSIDDIIAELTNTPLRLFDTEKSILENNLYGVDINEESVEIAKLSLWLRTARKDRKLSNLNNNIKCGNSLIDDPEVAGDKAFNWNEEFPQIFQPKKKEAWHITTATHNSRYSQRMFDYHVKMGEAEWIDEKDEITITEAIAKIIKEDNLNVIEYNICGDHMHMLLVCEKEEVPKIVGKIKAVSSRKRNIDRGITISATNVPDSNGSESVTATRGHVPLSRAGKGLPSSFSTEEAKPLSSETGKKRYNSLWTQKFGNSPIDSEEYLRNAITYIRNNRKKHELPENRELEKIIASMTCSAEHAFRTEYKGGFDVVIGNPPYLRVQGLRENFEKESVFYEEHFESATGRFDIYVLFMERSFMLINKTGLVSFILPHKFLVSDFGEGIRQFFVNNGAVKSILNFGSEIVFADASTYTCIINLSQSNSEVKFKQTKPNEIFNDFTFDVVNYYSLSEAKWNLKSKKIEELFQKLNSQPFIVKDIFRGIFQGIVSGDNKAFYLENCVEKGDIIEGYNSLINQRVGIEKGICKHLANGKEIGRYNFDDKSTYLIYTYEQIGEKTVILEEDKLQIEYPKCYSYLLSIKERLSNRGSARMKYPKWYSLWNNRNINNQLSKKILTPDVCFGATMYLDELGSLFYNDTSYALILETDSSKIYKIYLGILNSTLTWFYLKNSSSELRGGYFRFKTKYLEPFPLPKLENIEQQNPFIEKADKMLKLNKQFQQKKNEFLHRAKDNFVATATTRGHVPLAEDSPLKITKKLDAFYNFDFKIFVAELKKQKVAISLKDQVEWEEFFNIYKTEANNLQSEIDKTDKEIDQMVYKLYGLTEEEIGIVEESV